VTHAAVRSAKFTIFKIDSADSAGDQFISNVSDKFTSDNGILARIAGISVLHALLHVYYYHKNINMCFIWYKGVLCSTSVLACIKSEKQFLMPSTFNKANPYLLHKTFTMPVKLCRGWYCCGREAQAHMKGKSLQITNYYIKLSLCL
jgi:hypothetical protein